MKKVQGALVKVNYGTKSWKRASLINAGRLVHRAARGRVFCVLHPDTCDV